MTELDDPFRDETGLYVVGALGDDARRAFEAHLATCPACAAEVRSLRAAVDALPFTLMPGRPSDDLRERVLESAARVRRPTVYARETGDAADTRATRTRMWTTAPWLAAAAAFLVAALVGMHSTAVSRELSETQARLAATVRQLTDTERQLQTASRDASSARATLAVLAAPDVVEYRLTGQRPAPAARARAFLSRSRGLLFTATNLPAIAESRTYQLWYLTPGAPVSAGLLRPDAAGGVTDALNVSPDAPTPTGLAVSVEPAGGVPAPTGPIYLLSQ